MPLSVGEKLGPYEILAPIGAGGMGEVYRARDPRLNRDVAIKVSAAQFTERFEREAKAIAALNHPHICTLHDVGPNYLVMEYIEGTPLKGPLPLDQTLKYAAQICDALDAAHTKKITHRDLKPANILVTKSGVKLLDFGLAKIDKPVAMDRGVEQETVTAGLTGKGQILGTLLYMSPEQVNGQEADARSDIFSFGLVLYEMLTGKRAFEGSTPASVIAAILERPAPSVADVAPAALDRLLKRCLEKDPENRWQTARDLRAELEWIASAAPEVERIVPSRPHLSKLPWALAAVSVLIATGVSAIHYRAKAPDAPILRTTILPPEKTSFDFGANNGPVAVSPDGRRLVFTATASDGKRQLWVRPLDALMAQPLAGTDDARFPFWSPDSRYIGFFASGKLKKIDTMGGPAVALADAPSGRGGSWSSQGVIVFSPNQAGPLLRVSESGGAAIPATDLAGAGAHRFPWFLPDGRHFLYEVMKTNNTNDVSIQIASLDSQAGQFLVQTNSNAIYSQGHLLFLRGRTLMAVPFDAGRLATVGEAVPIAEQVQYVLANGRAGVFSASSQGLLAYDTGVTIGQTLTWFDRNGKSSGTLDQARNFSWTNFSPDRKRLAASVLDPATSNLDIWIYDMARGLPTRFTFDPKYETGPTWSPDGRTLIFASDRKGKFDLYRRLADGSGKEELVYEDELDKQPWSWSPDGKFLLYEAGSRNVTDAGGDVLVLPLTGEPKPFPFVQTPFSERRPQFSPDGRWITYMSDESGRYEIYAAPFPGPGGKRQISTGGGVNARWRQDGKEIFYIAPNGRLMAAEVNVRGNSLDVGGLVALPISATDIALRGIAYDVSADGQRFLVATSENASPPLTLVQNWTAGLKK